MTGEGGGRAQRWRGGPRFVFVGGLHRTGTSLVARLIARHPAISSITDAPVPENEGVYLQGAIPHTARDGVPGHYATDPAQHLIEGCRFDTLAVRDRLLADWTPWFAPGARWWLDKSPGNLVRTRLYQQLFPMAHFVLILRHPEAMAAALAKWSDRPAEQLIDYALDAYELAFGELEFLHCAAVLRYEDLVADAERELVRLWRFLDLAPGPLDDPLRDGNADYEGAVAMTPGQATRAARYGYGAGLAAERWCAPLHHPLRHIAERASERIKRPPGLI